MGENVTFPLNLDLKKKNKIHLSFLDIISITLNNIYLLLFSADKGDGKEFVHVPFPSKLEKNIKQGSNSIDMINDTLP